ncbi:restriction endonuclease subunit S [Paraburkholderia aspalathi]|uniref:restriction endonuclease subunit S n=1 Tax=Paraburkholderia aspalathi TaxID=1324617 RepID=UPI0038BCBEB5
MKLNEGFQLLATAPDGVARLRELILSLAIQGKLAPQDKDDEPVNRLLDKISAEKDRLVAEGKIKQDKPLPAITENDKPFELPEQWAWVRAQDICTVITDGDHQPPPKASEGVPFLVIGDVRWGSLDVTLASRFVPDSYFDQLDWSKKPLAGDILYTTVGSFGIPVQVTEERRFCFQRHIGLFRPAQTTLQPFLNLVLASNLVFQQASARATGIAQKTVPLSALRDFKIPFPPLAEQARIVVKVDELMRLCDELEARGRLEAEHHTRLTATLFDALAASESPHALAENWSRIAAHFDLLLDRPEAVGALERTILQLAVRGQLVPQEPNDEPASKILEQLRADSSSALAVKIPRAGETPTDAESEAFAAPLGWAWAPFDLVVECLNGYAFKSEWFSAQGVRLVRNTNISHGYIDWDQVARVDADTAAEFERFALEVGDIVLSLDRPIISSGLKYAEIKAADLPCLLLQRVAKLTPRAKSITRPFLKMWLTSPYFTDLLDPGRSNGVPHISTKQIGAIRFALPPVAEQHRIVARVQGLLRLCADLRARVTARQTCQARFAEALVGLAASSAPLVAHTDDLAAAA